MSISLDEQLIGQQLYDKSTYFYGLKGSFMRLSTIDD